MQSLSSKPCISAESFVIDQSSPSRPTTLLLRTHRPFIYNSWAHNNHLRLKNEKLTKRQQSSCRIAFYSLWICVSASIMIIVIYRFTDECSVSKNSKEFDIQCLRHWLFLLAICTSLFACCGVIFAICRYFRSQTLNFLYDDEHQRYFANNDNPLPVTMSSYSYYCPTPSSANGISNVPVRQIHHNRDESSNTTVFSSLTNLSLQRKIPPFIYDELPTDSNSISPNLINHANNRNTFFSPSTSTISSSSQLNLPSVQTSNATNRTIKSKTSSIFEDPCSSTPVSYSTCLDGVILWEKHDKLPSLH